MHPGAILTKYVKSGETEDNPVPMDQVYPALVECFAIIFLGYLAGKYVFS